MFGRAIKIGSIGGVPIKVDPSWVLVAVFVVYIFYMRVIGLRAVLVSERYALFIAVAGTMLFFGSVLIHEGAHAVVARRFGLEVRGITLVFWGGYTETQADRKGPAGEFLVSIAGPMSSLALGGAFWLLARLVHEPTAADLFGYLGWLNVFLAILNALPGFPLDGGRAFLAAVWKLTGNRRTAVQAAAVAGVIVGGALIALGALSVLNGDLGYAIWGFILGMVLVGAARQAQRRELLRQELGKASARDAMRTAPPTVSADLSLADALDRYLRGHEHESFPVVEGDHVIGVISFESARRLGAQDPMRPVRDGMVPLDEVATIQVDARLDSALDTLAAGRAALVMDDGRLVGSLRPSDVQRWLETRTGGAVAAPGGGLQGDGSPPARPDR
jgi:Zn-dependent protease/predicted transcriptional regulator